MGSIHAYENKSGKRYRVLYKKPNNAQGQKRGFKLKRDAQAFLDSVEVSKRSGQFIAPSDGRITIENLGAEWLGSHAQSVKPSTFHSDESAWRNHVRPMWGDRPVATLRRTEIKSWVASLSENRSATTVSRCLGVLSGILQDAVEDKRIPTNPAQGVKVARKTAARRAYLTHRQVEALAAESKYPDFVRFLAYTGLRWGEATGLRVGHVDRSARRTQIVENAVSVNGQMIVGTPKTHESRSVAYPAFLDAAIDAACSGKDAEALLWGDGESYLRPGNAISGWFAAARKRAQLNDPTFPTVTPHDLRHTAASLAISAGANIKVLQRMLGHASAAMTLDRYADLFEDDLDTVAGALNLARQDQLVGKKWQRNRCEVTFSTVGERDH